MTTNNGKRTKQQAKEQIYKAFRAYQLSWDDDQLSDVLSYCEQGVIEIRTLQPFTALHLEEGQNPEFVLIMAKEQGSPIPMEESEGEEEESSL